MKVAAFQKNPWLLELSVFIGGYAILAALLIAGWFRGGPPSFVGMDNYFRLLMNDDIFLVALRNTLLPPTIALVTVMALLFTGRLFLRRRRPHTPVIVLWLLPYGGAFLAFFIVSMVMNALVQVQGAPSANYSASTIISHLMDYPPLSGSLSAVSVWKVAAVWTLLLAVWLAEQIMKRLRAQCKKEQEHG